MRRLFVALMLSMLLPAFAMAGAPKPTITVTVSTDYASYSAGQVARFTAVGKYSTGATVTSIKTATITIKNPSGTTVVNAAAMTKGTDGTCVYNWTVPAGSAAGTWTASSTITDTNRVAGTGSKTFTVIAAKTHDQANAALTWTGYGTCISCHRTQAQAVYPSVHYQWTGSAAEMTTGPATQGKLDATNGSSALNAYCINVQGSWAPCGACHIGTGARPVVAASPTDAQLASIDCLMCHSDQKTTLTAYKYARTRNVTTGLFEPNAGLDMNYIIRGIVRPSRANCLNCHAKAGGGDAVKRGDIALASATTTDSTYDVHMSSTRGNLSCQICHTFNNHRVTGRGSDLRPQDTTLDLNCSTATCHPAKVSLTSGHATTDVDHHTTRVACQTCHMPVYAKNASDTAATEATETHRTWLAAEWNATLNRWEPTPTKANNLKPVYAFWDGTSWGNNVGDNAVLDPATGKYKISRPNGTINGPSGTKLFPFKYKTADQPMGGGKIIPIKVSTFFAQGDAGYDQAVKEGLTYLGLPTTTPYTTVTTDEYQLLNHQIPAKASVLACAACHPNATATQMKLVTNFGYTLKGASTVICAQCHNAKSPTSYDRMHDRHVATEGFDCSFCHNFTRPERGLSLQPH